MKVLVFIEWTPELEQRLDQPGDDWALRRDRVNESFVALMVESPELLEFCKAQPSCQVVPHPSTSVGRMASGLTTMLAGHIQEDAATVFDVLQDLGIRLD
jgi:hypothetical protein